MSDERLAAAARAWDAFRREALDLKRARNDRECENAEPYTSDVCWKRYVQTAPDDAERLPRDQWCASCVERQALHDRYREATKARGGRLRAMQRLAVTPQTAPSSSPGPVGEGRGHG